MNTEAQARREARIDTPPLGGTAGRPDVGSLSFDDALAELQRTVAELEAGGQALESSIELYERGVALHERCASLLTAAELRVQRLVERAGGTLATVRASVDAEAADEGAAS